MRGGVAFRPYALLSREVISQPGASHEVVLLRFAVDGAYEPGGARRLGFTQPTVHVKVRVPAGRLPRARTFSLVSDADADGFFAIAVKVIPGGRVSPYLRDLPVGAPALFSRTMTKRLARPLDDAPVGAALVAVAFGIGVAECVLTVRRAVQGGQRVLLIYAVRTSVDTVFLEALCALAAQHPPPPSSPTTADDYQVQAAGSFELCVLVSREEPSDALRAQLGAASKAGAAARALRGRVEPDVLAGLLAGPAWSSARTANLDAVFAIGSRAQQRAAYHMLAHLGFRHRLLGPPLPWGCW